MYIFVNYDLPWKPVKFVAQVAHVTQVITEEIIRTAFESMDGDYNVYERYMHWRDTEQKIGTKVVLRATEAQLIELQKLPEARSIYDDCVFGDTKRSKCLTVVGFFPSYKMSEVAAGYTLL